MPITINGSGTVTGISAGGLPDDCIVTADIAAGAVTQAKRSEQLTLDTAKASTSGTVVDFTGIPSWVKRVTVMFNGVSTNGTSYVQVQLGTAASFTTSGYVCGVSLNATNVSLASGIQAGLNTTAADARNGLIVFALVNSNAWSAFGLVGASGNCSSICGSISLADVLTRLRITTVNGTDTFDAGSINILYE